jgi:hypothetical protein
LRTGGRDGIAGPDVRDIARSEGEGGGRLGKSPFPPLPSFLPPHAFASFVIRQIGGTTTCNSPLRTTTSLPFVLVAVRRAVNRLHYNRSTEAVSSILGNGKGGSSHLPSPQKTEGLPKMEGQRRGPRQEYVDKEMVKREKEKTSNPVSFSFPLPPFLFPRDERDPPSSLVARQLERKRSSSLCPPNPLLPLFPLHSPSSRQDPLVAFPRYPPASRNAA